MLHSKPGFTSANAVVIFTKRESRHASIVCKTQESNMMVSFMSAHWRKRIWRRKILQPQNAVLVFRGLGAEPSTSFLQFGPDCIACQCAILAELHCLQRVSERRNPYNWTPLLLNVGIKAHEKCALAGLRTGGIFVVPPIFLSIIVSRRVDNPCVMP